MKKSSYILLGIKDKNFILVVDKKSSEFFAIFDCQQHTMSVSRLKRHTYIFFTSMRSLFPANYEAPITYEEKIRILNSPGNGNSDIYWVDAQIIEDFRNDSGKKK